MSSVILDMRYYMEFINRNGALSPEEFIGYMEAILAAKKALEEMFNASKEIHYERYNGFESKFDNYKKTIIEYKDKPNNFRLNKRYDWAKMKKDNSDTEILCDTVGDLADFLVGDVDKEREALLRKEKEVIKWKEKPVSKSINKNTLWTVCLGLSAIAAEFLLKCINRNIAFVLGIGVLIFLIIVICRRNKFFNDMNS